MNEKNKSIDDIIRNSDIAGFLSGIMGRNMGNVESNNSGLDSVLDSLVAMKSRGEDVESSGVDTTDKQQQLLKILLNSQPQPPNRSTYGGGTVGVVDSPIDMQMLMRNQEPVPQDTTGLPRMDIETLFRLLSPQMQEPIPPR
mgnify:FL=1|jgi:hypothetical protein